MAQEFAVCACVAGGWGKEGGGGGVCWQLLLFNFIFLPPSRNLCNVPAAPWEAGAAVSHCCRWNVTQSCCSPRQDMTRLPKPGRSPSTIACPRRRARTREIPLESSAPRFPQGYQPIAVGQSSGWGGRMGSFIYFDFFFLLFFFPLARKTLSTHSVSPIHGLPSGCGDLPMVLLPHLPGQALWESRESSWHCSCPSSRASVSPSCGEWRFPHLGNRVTSGCALRSVNSSCGGLLLILIARFGQGSGGREGRRGGREAALSHGQEQGVAQPCAEPQHARCTPGLQQPGAEAAPLISPRTG